MTGTILYSSATGNTKKLAEQIFEHVKNTGTWNLVNMDTDSVDVSDSEVVLLGAWVIAGTLNKKALDTLKSLDLKGKKLGIFATMGTRVRTEHGYFCFLNVLQLMNDFNGVATTLGVQTLQGYISPETMDKLESMPDEKLPRSIKDAMRDGVESYQEPTEGDYFAIANFFRNKIS